ncbi:phage tail terminator family protein [Viridibacillus sp. NPDC096237]|uniref:phage tail terminator family protein n=1 Tax=Viridibacillus sp. NPDC096237 TaxID=3390721 RepID=UPI003D0843B8
MQINDVVTAIAIKLHDTFGDNYTIYTESIEQGFQEPAFFIALLEPNLKQAIGNRYHKTIPFDIHYFGKGNMDAHITADKLMCDMEYIQCLNGDLLRGTKMRANLIDDVMHFFVNYNMHVYKEKEAIPMMEELTIQSHVKGEDA